MNNRSIAESVRNRKKIHKGAWMSIGHPVISELASSYDFDWILFDLEHGCISENALISNFLAVKNDNLAILVRIGKFDPLLISRILDWGAAGIMLSHVNSKEEALKCIHAMNYPPIGSRGFSSSSRSFLYGKSGHGMKEKHFNPLFFAQIETMQGVEVAEEIAKTDGVDVLFVGPTDLKLNWQLHHADQSSEEFWNVLARVGTAATLHKKQAGILVKNIEDIPLLRSLGYSHLSVASDVGILRDGFANITDKLADI